jgi:Flp pilus assembly protein TadD
MAVAGILMLAGCASTGGEDPYISAQGGPQAQARAQQQLHADLVREMIAQGRYYAALAHIQEIEKSQPAGDELRLLKAQVLAKLGRRQEAEQGYGSLMHGPLEGEARHGLGLLYADSNYPLSLQYLQTAATLLPTSAEVRNDLGYALLVGGYYPEGRLQLATAYELDAAATRNRNNYVLALLLVRDEASVRKLVSAGVVTQKQVIALRKTAKDWPRTVQRARATAQPGQWPASPPVPPPTPGAVTRPADDNMTVKEKFNRASGG